MTKVSALIMTSRRKGGKEGTGSPPKREKVRERALKPWITSLA